MATDIEVIVDPAAISTAVTIDPASVVASVTLATGAPGPQGEVGPQGPAGQSFNQSLNTTDSPTFDEVTASTFSGKDGGIDSLGRPGSDGGKIYLNGDANGVFILEGEEPYGWVSGNAGTIDLRGGGTNPIDDTGNGGSLILCGGTGNGANAGSINTSGGNYYPGGSINTSAGGERGGFINTSNGGGNIDTSAGYIELGALTSGSVTTLFRTSGEASGYSIALPAANGTVALTTDAPSAHTHPASEITDFAASVVGVVLTGLSTATNAAIAATDSVLSAFGKLQAQVSAQASAGYQTAAQVTTAITSYGYQTASQVLAALTWSNISGKPSTFTPASHNHAASEITSGTLALARLDPLVSLDNTDNNFSVNQTFQGTNNVAPNQTAASGSSLMTRSLGDSRYGLFFKRQMIQNWVSGATGGTYGSAGTFSGYAWQYLANSTANNAGFWCFGQTNLMNVAFGSAASGTNNLNYNNTFRLFSRFFVPSSAVGTSSTVVRMGFGGKQSATIAVGVPTTKYFGCELRLNGSGGGNIWLTGHNGTSAIAVNGGAVTITSPIEVVITSANGSLSLEVNGTVVATSSSGPTGTASVGAEHAGWYEQDMGGVSGSFRSFCTHFGLEYP